jgi:hypothetical protein
VLEKIERVDGNPWVIVGTKPRARLLDWLVGNYAPPEAALDPERYKAWRDTIMPDGGPGNYIDYLAMIGVLAK